MKSSRNLVTSLCLMLALTNALLPWQAQAANHTRKRVVFPSSTYAASAEAAPIGTVETSGTILINGRAASGKNAVWDGELVQALPGVEAEINLDSLGQLKVAGGSVVRLATALNTPGQADSESRVLLASVYEGQLSGELYPAARAYLEAGGKAWLASDNANFRLALREGAATLEAVKGLIGELGNWAVVLPSLSKRSRTVTSSEELASLGNWAINAPVLTADAAQAKTEAPRPSLEAQRNGLMRSIKLAASGPEAGAQRQVKLFAHAKARMIGMIEASGGVKINGREVKGRELVWDGELIQAPANAAAQVALVGIGQVTLAKGSVVKLTAAAENNSAERRVLAASIINGEINVKLQPEAGAFVENNGQAFAAEPGSRFRLSGRQEGAAVEIFAGNVREIGSWMLELSSDLMSQAAHLNAGPRQYSIIPLAESANNQPAGYLLNVRPKAAQALRFKVTDESGKPAPGLPVLFTLNALDGQPVGTLGNGPTAGKAFEATTDEHGVATVQFNAGAAAGSTSVSAVVRGTNSGNNNVVVVADDEGKFWTKRNAIPVFATAAAAVVAGIVIAVNRDDRLPIKGSGPTQIVP